MIPVMPLNSGDQVISQRQVAGTHCNGCGYANITIGIQRHVTGVISYLKLEEPEDGAVRVTSRYCCHSELGSVLPP